MQIFTHGLPTWEIPYSQREATVINELVKHIQKGAEIPPYVLANLDHFPRLAGRLRGAVMQNQQIRDYIKDRPLCLLYLILENYDEVADQFEELLLGNGMGEYIFELLAWSKETGHSLRKPVAYYFQFLTRDSFWGVRAARLLQREDLINDIAARSIVEKNKSASAAFFYLASNPEAEVEAYLPVFNEDPFYSLLGLQSFYPRRFTARGLNVKKLTARWAYHFLVFGQRAPEIECEAAVLKSPEWLVEYVMTKEIYKQNPTKAAQLYENCVRDSHPHALCAFLHSWYQRLQSKQGSP